MRTSKKYTDEQFAEAVKTSLSLREALLKLGVAGYGGNYAVAKRKIKLLNIDTSHLLGQRRYTAEARKHRQRFRTPLHEILIEDSDFTNTNHLKKRLVSEGLLEYRCAACKVVEWQGRSLVLELEHKNGVRTDNRIENLCLLCPNCHSQTDTFRGRNIQ